MSSYPVQRQVFSKYPVVRERQLVTELANIVRPSAPEEPQGADLEISGGGLSREIRFVTDYVNRQIFGENREYEGVFLGVEDLKSICHAAASTYLANTDDSVFPFG